MLARGLQIRASVFKTDAAWGWFMGEIIFSAIPRIPRGKRQRKWMESNAQQLGYLVGKQKWLSFSGTTLWVCLSCFPGLIENGQWLFLKRRGWIRELHVDYQASDEEKGVGGWNTQENKQCGFIGVCCSVLNANNCTSFMYWLYFFEKTVCYFWKYQGLYEDSVKILIRTAFFSLIPYRWVGIQILSSPFAEDSGNDSSTFLVDSGNTMVIKRV